MIIAFVLVMVGALNWGMVGVFNVDIVSEIFSKDSVATDIVYILVGLAAVYIMIRFAMCKKDDDADVDKPKAPVYHRN